VPRHPRYIEIRNQQTRTVSIHVIFSDDEAHANDMAMNRAKHTAPGARLTIIKSQPATLREVKDHFNHLAGAGGITRATADDIIARWTKRLRATS
jgi:hypothetical protein